TGCDHLEVGTGREDGSTAGDDDGPDLVVGFDVVEGAFDAPGDVAVDGVAGFGPVDREDLDPTSSFPLDDHDRSSRPPPSHRTRPAARGDGPGCRAPGGSEPREDGDLGEEVGMLETREAPEQAPETRTAQQTRTAPRKETSLWLRDRVSAGWAYGLLAGWYGL